MKKGDRFLAIILSAMLAAGSLQMPAMAAGNIEPASETAVDNFETLSEAVDEDFERSFEVVDEDPNDERDVDTAEAIAVSEESGQETASDDAAEECGLDRRRGR